MTDSPNVEREAAGGRVPWLPGLDGIRGLAVACVVLYHAGAGWLPAGFLGVDVFFVVSGFLITALLAAERERSGGASLRGFWMRRAKRLLPALAAVLAATTVFAAAVLGDSLVDHLREVLSAAVYLTNWDLIVREVSYFDTFERPSQLRHLWSLAVEEQFYVLWPLAFLAAVRLGGSSWLRRLTWFAALAAAASVAWMAVLYEPASDPSRAYFGSDARAFTILIGVLLGLHWRPWRRELGRAAGIATDAAGLGGLAVIGTIMARTSSFDAWLYPTGLLLLSLAAAAAIAAAARPGGLVEQILSWRPLRYAGSRSYGIYLWHWPVLLALEWEAGLAYASPWLLAAGAGATLALAEASYRWVERPVREGRFWEQFGGRRVQAPRAAWAAMGAAVIAATAAGFVALPTQSTQTGERPAAANEAGATASAAPEFALPPRPSRAGAAAMTGANAGGGGDEAVIGPVEAPAAEAPPEPISPEGADPETMPEPAAAAEGDGDGEGAEDGGEETSEEARVSGEGGSGGEEGEEDEEDEERAGGGATEPASSPPETVSGAGGAAGTGDAPLFELAVVPGDTPGALANAFGVPLETLVELNGAWILETIRSGDVLRLPCPTEAPCAVVEVAPVGEGCVSWTSALGEDERCGPARVLAALPVRFEMESDPLAGPARWTWGHGTSQLEYGEGALELTAERAARTRPGSRVLTVVHGLAPLAVGDSVMADAARELRKAGIEVDAVGARSARESIAALRDHLAREGARETVIFQGIGFGFVSEGDFALLMEAAAEVEHVVVLTTQFPARPPWTVLEREANRIIREQAPRYPGVTVVDWNALTDGRERELTTDGTHLSRAGLRAYVDRIVAAVQAGAEGGLLLEE